MPPHPDAVLSEEHIGFLSEFLNPVYLQPRTMEALSARFADESSLELHSFLSNSLAQSLEPRLRELDAKDGLGEDRNGRLPPHSAGTKGSWLIKGPPHKWRYCTLKPRQGGKPAAAVTPRAAHGSSDEILRSLQDELFPSAAFRAWMAIVSRLLPLSHSTEARRFRPGLDYTLATSEEKDARLDVVLGLTPGVKEAETGPGSFPGNGKALATAQQDVRGWQGAEWGGWEVSFTIFHSSLLPSNFYFSQCYMAPHNEEDDPAVYRSGTQKATTSNGSSYDDKPTTNNANHASSSGGANGSGKEKASGGSPPTDADEDMEVDDDEDSTLLTVQPGFNCLLLVLRDERVMRFVKYVSAAAEGSRWDVCGEYEVGMMAEDDEDDS